MITLPGELVSLVHHIELNKAGWWNRGIQRFVLGVIWLCDEPLSVEKVADELRSRFGVDVDDRRLKQQVDSLRATGTILSLPDGRLKISEHALIDLQAEIKEAEQVENKARAKFDEIFTTCCPTLRVEQEWKSFTEGLLLPLVREVGARTYQLISGTAFSLESTVRFPQFLAGYQAEHRPAVRDAVVHFLDPKDPNVRSYLLRHLNAYFFVEAGNLQAGAVESLNRMATRPPSFNVFVDTNFLFSFLGLHENPSNDAAKSLMELTAQLEGKVSCRFYVSPPTLDETKRVIGFHRDYLQSLQLTRNLAQAALEANLSGISRKFVESSRNAGLISADDYFRPYLTNLKATLRAKSVEFFNEPMDSLGVNQEVVDDIIHQLEFEKKNYGNDAKTYESLKHDLVLWHFVKGKRPVRVESPLEASYWIVSVDYHFLAFDSFKNRNSTNQIPICLHPTALIQMLQFWLPRTPRFEEAVLGSLRWPFLFQDFDPAAEQVTIRILKTLARFENIDQLPHEIVTSILVNDALRGKLALDGDVQRQVELVKEALVEENQQVRSQLTVVTEETNRLKGEVAGKDGEIRQLQESFDRHKKTVDEALLALQEERERRQEAEDHLRCLDGKRELRKFVTVSIGALIVLLLVAVAFVALSKPALGFGKTTSLVCTIILLMWSWMADRWGQTKPVVRDWSPYRQFRKLRVGLFVLLAWVICWNWFEKLGHMLLYGWLKPHL